MAKKNIQNNQDWYELCDYVKYQILNYNTDMKLPRNLILKLQGLKKGQHIANNNIEAVAKYDDYTILCAFKLCRNKILTYLKNNETKIKDENHKINLIIKMVEPEVNDIYIRIKQAKSKEDKMQSNSFENQYNVGAEYKSKVQETSNKLKNLW